MTLPGLLLTGGASRRMGTPKAELLLHGEALAARAARVLGAVCEPVVEVGPGYTGLAHVVEDPPGGGPVAALVAGWDALGGPEAVLLLACDLPFPDAALLLLLATTPGASTVVPVAGGRPQPTCARYGRAAVEAARAGLAAGRASFRDLLGATEVELLGEDRWRAVAGPDALVDVDTPERAARFGIEPPR